MKQDGYLSEADADKLAKVVASGYEKAASYSRVILGLGYAALLAIWSGTHQLMTERLAISSALLTVVSILAYIFFEISQMLFFTWVSYRFSRVAADKGLRVALTENEKTLMKWQPRIYIAWFVALLFALPTGLAGQAF